MPKTDIIIKKRAENVNVNNINVGIHVYCIHNHFMTIKDMFVNYTKFYHRLY